MEAYATLAALSVFNEMITMSLKQELQKLHNRIDNCQRKLDAAKGRGDQAMISKFANEIEKLSKKANSMKHKQQYNMNKERKNLLNMPFSREITKAEQADMGKLKKSVKGLVVVHPMTKLGKELKLQAMTGYAPKKF
ncbi:conserved hypothetical protein [Vibrio nigripulchritudo SFn118]|nr:conserved hypothetical protein [Vibrio nigripulchritudo SFn118]